MAWKPGQSGNPGGRPREKQFLDALRLALNEGDNGRTRLRQIADKVVEAAVKGEPWAIAQIADRLDGRPAQALEHSTPDGPLEHRITGIQRTIVDPRDTPGHPAYEGPERSESDPTEPTRHH